jgi:uncharacterized protein YgbK (DUF1537 family)
VELLLTFYGDDFTGSADAMEALALGGVPTALFLEPPRPERLTGRFAGLGALGVAGIGRTLTPSEMDAELPAVFGALRRLGAPLVHYKVCSTFDSSPGVGSIGHAIDIGCRVLEPRFVPVAVGVPVLRRFVVFGNHFAAAGDEVFRLDRHPSMSRHPVTPMRESDLRQHLARQTEKAIGLIDVRHLSEPAEAISARLDRLVAEGKELILFDTLDEIHLRTVGQTLWAQSREGPLLLVGSSGVEYALVACWQALDVIRPADPFPPAGRVDPLLVVSGSAARETAAQISWARSNGFRCLGLDAPALVDPETRRQAQEEAVAGALEHLDSGTSVVLFSAEGPDDPAIGRTKERAASAGLAPEAVGRELARAQGRILRDTLERSGVRRVCTVGGDTCGHVARQLSIYALEFLMPLAPAAPLCRASAEDPGIDGLQIAMKGGQIGAPDYFRAVQQGQL